MKILLIAVTLLVVIEVKAHPGWAYPNFQDGTRNNPGRGPPWTVPQRMENPNNRFNSDVEWVCRNPRTNDIIIIASDDTRHTPQYHPGKGPWWQWQNVPPGHQKEHQHGNHWTPIIIVQEIPDTDKNQTPSPPFTTSETPNNNNNNGNPTQQPPYHGGEGSIDIRVATE